MDASPNITHYPGRQCIALKDHRDISEIKLPQTVIVFLQIIIWALF